MCRSIKVLRRPETPVTDDEISAAARQFIRKVSGFHKPSKRNEDSFEKAIREVAATTTRLLDEIGRSSRAAAEPVPSLD